MRSKTLLLAMIPSLLRAQGAPGPTPSSVVEQRVKGTPMHYFVSLPEGWTPEREWPVVVVITDAYREFETTAQSFATDVRTR